MRAVNNREELKTLLEQQQKYLPMSSSIYGIIANELDYGIGGPLNSKIYIPDKTLEKEYSSLVLVYPAYDDVPNEGCFPLAIFWDSDVEEDSEIASQLLTISCIDWKLPVSVLPAPITVIKKLQLILESEQFSGQKRKLDYLMDGQVYSLHKDAAKPISLPDGYKLRSLHPSDLDYMKTQIGPTNENDKDVSTQLSLLPSAALVKTQTDGSEVLVSWATLRFCGEIGRIFTVKDHRGRGLAKIVALALANQMFKSREEVYVSIDAANAASIRLNTSIGFQGRYLAGIATINKTT